MKTYLLFLLAAAAAPAFAQGQSQCIIAGRVSEGRWAPHFETVHLRDANGRGITSVTPQALATARSAELSQPALLSACDGDQRLLSADGEPAGVKSAVPALSPGVVEVEAVNFPKLRTGGALVELRVRVPEGRVVAVMR